MLSIKETYKASSTNEALELLEKYGDQAKIIAGGTDIVIDLRNNKINPDVMIDVSSIREIKYIKEEDGYISLGAATTFTEVAYSELLGEDLNGLKKSARLVGSPLIRNRGTVGGNICHGSPAADIVPPLLALDAVVTIKSNRNTREEKLEDIFLGKGKVDLKPCEMLTDIRFKKPTSNQKLGFSKLGLRNALAISRICISVYLDVDNDNIIKDIKVASGALGVNGMRERLVEDTVRGLEINKDTINLAAEKMVESVQDRLKGRSSLEYKGKAVKSLFIEAMKSASGKTLS